MKANITTKCNRELQEDIRSLLQRFFHNLPINESEKNQLVLAIDEAVMNAIIHGNKEDASRSVEISIDVREKRVVIEIADVGQFDIENDESRGKDLDKIIEDRQKGGLGLKLIYSIMDVVSFYSRDMKGYCYMVKLLS